MCIVYWRLLAAPFHFLFTFNQKVLHVYRKWKKCSVEIIKYNCGANSDVNHYENCVLPITIFFVNSATKLGILVQARCLSRDNYRLVKC